MLRFAAAFVTQRTEFLRPLLETHTLMPDVPVHFAQSGDDNTHWMIGSEILTGPRKVEVTPKDLQGTGVEIGIKNPKSGTIFTGSKL
jgi:hypothetical protein